MIISIIALALGLLIGYYLPFELTTISSLYISVGLLAGIDSIVGGIRASLDGKFDSVIFISGFLVNAFLAIALSYVGDKLGVPIYYAAIFVFGTRLFDNMGKIRRYVISKIKNKLKRDTVDDVDIRNVSSIHATVDVTKQ